MIVRSEVRLAVLTILMSMAACVYNPPSTVPKPPAPPPIALDSFGTVMCAVDPVGGINGTCPIPVLGVTVEFHTNTAAYAAQSSNSDGFNIWTVPVTPAGGDLTFTKDGYLPQTVGILISDLAGKNNIYRLYQDWPEPPSRQEILDAHGSFQGSVLHTTCYGDLNWWPTAWVSLPDNCREDSYAQIASWGDTDITVSVSWSYGEPGQPYGDGQVVPNADLTCCWPRFRQLVKEVIGHKAANGRPFIPRIFLEGDNGYNYYMWVMPLAIKALQPQPDDPIDLTQHVKLQMCYDSCVPGWQPKTQVGDAALATRAACPNCIIAMEFSSGYSSTGDGDAFWHSDAGRAIDEVDWEGNYWPPTNWEQYWEILDRWLGPSYVRPAAQVSDPTAPFAANSGYYYLRNGTPRGAYSVHCFEPFTYQWVRGQVPASQVPVAYHTLQSLGCGNIDMPTPK